MNWNEIRDLKVGRNRFALATQGHSGSLSWPLCRGPMGRGNKTRCCRGEAHHELLCGGLMGSH